MCEIQIPIFEEKKTVSLKIHIFLKISLIKDIVDIPKLVIENVSKGAFLQISFVLLWCSTVFFVLPSAVN